MIRKFFAIAALAFAPLSTQASAFNCAWDGDLSLTGGYRSDCFETAISVYDDEGEEFLKDQIKGNSIDVYQIGVKGRAFVCCQYLLRGHANYGTIGSDGKYTDTDTLIVDDESEEIKAKIKDGHTQDYSIGIGYLYPFASCLRIGPTVGYSYIKESVTMADAKLVDEDIELPILDDLVYWMRWQGPWLGADALYTIGCFDLHLGYEYHWCDWRAEWLLDGPDVFDEAFSDKRKASDAYANIFFVDVNYSFYRCWNIGLGFKYQYWKVDRGSVVPKNGTYEDVGEAEISKAKVTRADLVTYGFQVSLGRHF